jgi:alpha-D-ribose 1-methylphosphonate 5-triphosphate synthase subunit PhnH
MLTVEPGFADVVGDSQRCFRAVLDAMARPGRLAVIDMLESPPAGISPAAGAILLTLADVDAPVWLGAHAAKAADWIRFHTGASILGDPTRAHFAYVAADELPDIRELNLGTDEYPDRSTTVIVEVPRFAAQGPLLFRGPGIETSHSAAIDGLDPDFWSRRAGLHEIFPRGIDCIFVCGSSALALPRTTHVEA